MLDHQALAIRLFLGVKIACIYFFPSKKSKSLRPVMFWIHGGANTSGLKIYMILQLVRKHNDIDKNKL